MKRVALILFGVFLFSCTTVSVLPVNNAKFGNPTNNVTIYSNRDAIERKYEEIAIIFSESDAGMVGWLSCAALPSPTASRSAHRQGARCSHYRPCRQVIRTTHVEIPLLK